MVPSAVNDIWGTEAHLLYAPKLDEESGRKWREGHPSEAPSRLMLSYNIKLGVTYRTVDIGTIINVNRRYLCHHCADRRSL